MAAFKARSNSAAASLLGAVCLLLTSVCGGAVVETELPSPASPAQLQETNFADVVQVLLQMEEQLRSYRVAVEQSANEARQAAARNAEEFSNGLKNLEAVLASHQQAFSSQTARELETIQSSNRLSVVLAGLLGGMAVLAMLLIAYFQWRMSRAWAGVSALLPVPHGLGEGSAVEVLSAANPSVLPPGSAEQSALRLLGVIGQLEKRVESLEQCSSPGLKARSEVRSGGNGDLAGDGNGGGSLEQAQTGAGEDPRIPAFLAQGQSMLKQKQWEAALKCFDEILSVDPKHGQALVKRGIILERLQRLQEAFECYDRAIAADASLTIAYLHKGGLCNRLERFKEALECYEKALQTQGE